MNEYLEPYIAPKKSAGTLQAIIGLVPGLRKFIATKSQEYYLLKKTNHWQYFSQGTVLDLGCGFGQFMECAPEKIAVIGINLNDDEIAVGRKKGLKIVKADCRKLPFRKDSVDGINCSHLVEHIIEPIDVLEEGKRVLKPDGVIVVRTPDLVRHFEHFYDDPSHINPFTKKKVEKILVYSGYKNVKVIYGDCTLNWLKPLTLFPRIRIAIENLISPIFSHELVGIAQK